MNKIFEMREKRAKRWDAAKAFLDAHTAEDGTISAEDSATYDRMEAEVASLGRQIERLERQAAIDRELDAPVNKPITDRPQSTPERRPEKTGRASDAYRGAF